MSSYDSLRYYKRLLHSGIMAMDPKTGQIKAWVGGVDFNHFQYDHVKQSRRQPGSTFKAFVYAAAIDQGYSPCFKIQDKWIDIEYDEDSAGIMLHKHWKPGNANGNFSGMNMTLRHGMGRSINTIAAQLTMMVGPQKVLDCAAKLGIDSSYLKPLPSIGLGPYDVNLYEMVGAYSTFVNEGTWQEPQLITRIEDRNGKTIKEFTPKMRKALTTESAWLMVYMLKGTLQEPQGTAQGLFSFNIFKGNELAGKTGTSQNNSDGWFIGLSKDLVAGVWTGADERAVHFRNLRMGEGSKTALPVYGRFMEKVYADKSLGITMGYFPKSKVPITRKYICPTIYPKKDTSKIDSTKSVVDSSGASAPISID
jgi:penicillin-binding protein 1A